MLTSLSASQVNGQKVAMKATDPRHFGFKGVEKTETNLVDNFGSLLQNSFNKVNDAQVEAMELQRELATNPRNVQIHDVTIAAQKAEIALTLAVNLRDKAVRAYQEIISMR